MMQHLVLFDGDCPLCDAAVGWIVDHDPQRLFLFSSLNGRIAQRFKQKQKEEESLLLVVDFQGARPHLLRGGKALLRIFWLLGGIWALLGLFSFAPSFLYEWLYRFVARRRHLLVISCRNDIDKERFIE